MKHTFKVGDTVEVIDAYCTSVFKVGDRFPVLHVKVAGTNSDCIGITKDEPQWDASRFKLVEAAATPEALVEPPLGLRPREVAKQEFCQARTAEILAAMTRYSEAGKQIPHSWTDELKDCN